MAELNPNRRLEVDSVLRCEKHGPIYRVFRRQNQQADGTLLATGESEIWPHPSHPSAPPPLHTSHITCPECGAELRRAAP